jgi:hypothetical protein
MIASGRPTVPAAVRLLVPLTLIAIALTALASILVLYGDGIFSERAGPAVIVSLLFAVVAILALCNLATAGTRYWAVGVLGGLVLAWSAAYTVLLTWDDGLYKAVSVLLTWEEHSYETVTMARLHTSGLILTFPLAQIALLLGVAGDHRRLRVVLWPTLAVTVAAAALAIPMALNKSPAADREYHTLVVLTIASILGTILTLALALFGPRSPEKKTTLADQATHRGRVGVGVRWAFVATVIVLGLLAAAGWWWSSWKSHPAAFRDYREDLGYAGGEYELSQGPYRIQVADPLVRSGIARIDEVEPVVVTNTADARITFSVCTLKPRGGESFGGAMEDMTRFCSEVIPLEEGHVLPLGHHTGQQVTMNIDPAHAGTVQVAGVRVTYKHGMQYGTQVVSNSASVQFVDSSRSGG